MDERKELLEFLKDLRKSQGPWIHRKEIASWSSVVIYFGIIYALFRLDFKSPIFLILAFGSVIIFCRLILCFIKNQFCSIANASALHHALTYHIFKIINTGDIFQYSYKNICIDQNKIVPYTINSTKVKYEVDFKNFVNSGFIKKICFIFKKRKKSNDEIKLYSTILQLIVSYFLVFLITTAFLLYIIANLFINNIFLFMFSDIFIVLL